MPDNVRAEIYFIAVMMFIILVVCSLAVYFFIKTYRKEKLERDKERLEKLKPRAETSEPAE